MEETQVKLKKQYTLYFILNSSILQEDTNNCKEKVNEKIQALNGQIEASTCEQRLSKLAYPINKVASGFICESAFVIDSEKIRLLSESLKHTKDLARFIIESKKEAPKIKPRIRRRKITDAKITTGPERPQTLALDEIVLEPIKERREKISIEEIDKKLDEIIKNI